MYTNKACEEISGWMCMLSPKLYTVKYSVDGATYLKILTGLEEDPLVIAYELT